MTTIAIIFIVLFIVAALGWGIQRERTQELECELDSAPGFIEPPGLLPSGDHALLDARAFDLVMRDWQQNPEDKAYLAARQIVAGAIIEALNELDSAAPDNHGRLAAATGEIRALTRLLGDLHRIAHAAKKRE